MISTIWHTIVFQPLLNLLVLIIDFLPGHSAGFAIILVTFIVKVALFPLTGKSIEAQRSMKELEPELKQIREKHAENKQLIAQKTMELYQQRGVSPFSGCLPILIQIPIIFGLYWVFKSLPIVDEKALYGFVQNPGILHMQFLVFDLLNKSLFLAVIAGVSQFIQASISLRRQPSVAVNKSKKPSFQEDFARSMQMQMKYVLPVMIGVISYNFPAAIALYWATSNILGIGQELLIDRKKNKMDKK